MPLKIVSIDKLTGSGDITKSQIDQLRLKYVNNTGKIRKGKDSYDDFDNANHTVWAWFSLSEIVRLLTENGVNLSDPNSILIHGIRVYFGMHHIENEYQPKPGHPHQPKDYYYHDTPIFVVTKKVNGKNEDLLNANNFITLAGGTGLDNAQLCPPECNP